MAQMIIAYVLVAAAGAWAARGAVRAVVLKRAGACKRGGCGDCGCGG